MSTRREFDVRPYVTDRFLERFWSKAHRPDGPDVCWPWFRAVNEDGYGHFLLRKHENPAGAHRVAYALANGGVIPAGGVVCHRCDNPACVRPAHLFLGTQLDNIRDCIAKNRHFRTRGESHHKARLDDEKVRAIRAAAKRPGLVVELAALYGVSQSTIRSVRRGEFWRHVA